MPTKLILIRHGETAWSSQKRYCGISDVELNENGRKQALLLAGKLSGERVDKIYSSDRKRTWQFARIVFPGLPVEKVPELQEINFGIFEGFTYRQILKTHPEIYRAWLANPVDTQIPGGESLSNLAERVKKILEKILADNRNKTIAVVTHSGPIRIILGGIRKLELKNIWQIKPDLASVNIVEFNG
ncbi:MAG: histidine phosphatase family protein [Elusimicrobiota bacterium]